MELAKPQVMEGAKEHHLRQRRPWVCIANGVAAQVIAFGIGLNLVLRAHLPETATTILFNLLGGLALPLGLSWYLEHPTRWVLSSTSRCFSTPCGPPPERSGRDWAGERATNRQTVRWRVRTGPSVFLFNY